MNWNETLVTLSTNTTTPKPNVHSKSLQLTISEWLLVAAFILILVIGLFGNSFVIYVFGFKRKRGRKTTTEWLIVYLGIIDLLSTLFNSALFVYWTLTKHLQWTFGYIGCKSLTAIGPILTTASSGVILIFAIDRYVAIVKPFQGELSHRQALIALVINVVLSALSYFPYIYTKTIRRGRCVSPPFTNLAYGIPNCTLIILRLFIFASVFLCTSFQIFISLRRNERRTSVKVMRRKANQQSRSIARVLFTVGFVFIILVFPRELFYLIIHMSWITTDKGIMPTRSLLHANSWLKVMHTANCCANIFIYAHMHSRLRRYLLTFIYCGNRSKEQLGSASFSSVVMTNRYESLRKEDLNECRMKDCEESYV